MKTNSEAELRAYRFFRRWAGVFVILGGIAIFMSGVSHTLGAFLTVTGLAVLGLRPSGQARALSLAGWVLAFIGAWAIFLIEFMRLSAPTMQQTSPFLFNNGSLIAGSIFLLGLFLLGLSVGLNKEYPAAAGLGLAIATLLVYVLGDWGAMALGAVLVWLGFLMLFNRTTKVEPHQVYDD